MTRRVFQTSVLAVLITCAAFAQTTTDPFPNPIPTTDRVIAVKFAEFATIPDFNGMVVFIDGESVRDRDHLSDAVGPQSVVDVIQALSGG